MGIFLSHPTPMYCDDKKFYSDCSQLDFHEQTKHNKIDCHLTRHHFKHDTITLPFVSSSLQLTDFFTKSHSFFLFLFFS